MWFVGKNTKLESVSTNFFLHLFNFFAANLVSKSWGIFSVWKLVTLEIVAELG